MRLILLIFSLILILQSCSTTKHVPKNKSLLVKNNVIIQNDYQQNFLVTKSDILNILRQKPNKKIFGFYPFHLNIYNLSDSLNKNWLHKYLRKIGEEPVLFNKELISKSKIQIERLLANKGYFNSIISSSIKTNNKKTSINYNIQLGKVYKLNEIIYPKINNSEIESKIKNERKALLKKGDLLNADKLDLERIRITEILQNNGYFNFKRENIFFEVDTSINNDSTKIYIKISDAENQLYSIDEVIVLFENQENNFDTIIWNDLTLINLQEQINKNIIGKAIDVKKNELYSKQKIISTRKKLSDLNIFKTINIELNEIENTEKNILKCIIKVNPQTKMYYSLETEGTHSSGNLGASLNLRFGNKNSFKGAENFNFKFRGALETLNSLTENQSFFNTWEIGGEGTLEIPRLLIPNNYQKKISNIISPKTRFSLSLSTQQRPDFKRLILKTTLFGYNFFSAKNHSHFLNLAEISYVSILNQSENFSSFINASPFLTYQYTNHLISASSYTYIFNNQELNKIKNHSFFKFRFETSGLSLNTLAQIFNFNKGNIESYEFNTILGNRFTQYIKGEMDYRKYIIANKENILAIRFYSGISYAYGNSRQMPPQKQFFSGGTNGIRAWNPFSLGPGAYQSTENENYFLGDIKLEANIEYRFPLFNVGSYRMKGALFIDGGNIWSIREDDYDNSLFTNNFLNEIAIGTGFGLRYDVNFVIFRLDLGIPLKNPYIGENNSKWIKEPIKNAFNGNVVLNLGIGYPF